jgi:hypothetical protein
MADWHRFIREFGTAAGGILITGGFMSKEDIIVQIEAEISRLQQAKALLTGTRATDTRIPSRPSGAGMPGNLRRTMSIEAREKIAAAQRARWAKSRKAAKKAAPETHAKSAAKKATAGKAHLKRANKRTMSAGARERIAAAQKARWAKVRAGKKDISTKSAKKSSRVARVVSGKKAVASKAAPPAAAASVATPTTSS